MRKYTLCGGSLVGYGLGTLVYSLCGGILKPVWVVVGSVLPLATGLSLAWVMPWFDRRAVNRRQLGSRQDSPRAGVKEEGCVSRCTLAPLTFSPKGTSESSKEL